MAFIEKSESLPQKTRKKIQKCKSIGQFAAMAHMIAIKNICFQTVMFSY